jgi:hypothetical protein
MSAQPGSHALGGAVGEHVDRSVGLNIDQQRAVLVAPSLAKSSTPSTRGAGWSGSGGSGTMRSSVVRLTRRPTAGLPPRLGRPSASATAHKVRSKIAVRRA